MYITKVKQWTWLCTNQLPTLWKMKSYVDKSFLVCGLKGESPFHSVHPWGPWKHRLWPHLFFLTRSSQSSVKHTERGQTMTHIKSRMPKPKLDKGKLPTTRLSPLFILKSTNVSSQKELERIDLFIYSWHNLINKDKKPTLYMRKVYYILVILSVNYSPVKMSPITNTNNFCTSSIKNITK